MKTINAPLLAHYQGYAKTLAEGIRITRTDGQVFRWVNHDRDVDLYEDDGSPSALHTYLSQPGISLSSVVSTEGFAADTATITVLEDEDITRADILAGVWDGAEMEIFQFNWASPTDGRNILKRGKLGNFKAMRGYSTVEFRDLRQPIQSQQETVLQPTCRYKLGDSRCGINLAGSPGYTVTGTVDGSDSQYTVTDSARTEADDWFGEGTFTFTSGPNAGMSRKVKTYSLSGSPPTAGVFVFWQQWIYPIGADDYSVTAGCRLRFQEDCIAKFDNGVNFGGEPNKDNPDSLTAPVP